uniref:Uncharacterized protein n=1 Tax=viral metagenome TaxID=1070528 RepID=A0A6C0IED1_9ZZZZ
MKKYNIEEGIDFYSELYKSLDIEENINKLEADDNICLISNLPLTNNYIKMKCGHKFNYEPLFKDLVNHKSKFNILEASSGRLNKNEIRCPYCRAKQSEILPYYEDLGLPKISGINYINPVIVNKSYIYKTCEYLTLNNLYDPSGNNPLETAYQNNGNCKFLKCFFHGSQLNSSETNGELIEYMQDKSYCWKHKKLIYKEFKNNQKEKIKEENKQLKLKEKADIKKAKEDEKLKLKEEQLKIKAELKKSVMLAKLNKKPVQTEVENTIISSNINILIGNNETKINNGCTTLLKSGTKKGTYCGCKVFNDNLCKRHHNLMTKENIVS